MSEDSYNSDSEPIHPDMTTKFINNQDQSQIARYQNQHNKTQSTRDQESSNSMDKNTNEITLNQQDNQLKFLSENGNNDQEFDISFKQFEVIPNQLNNITNIYEQEPKKIYKRKILDKLHHQNKKEINMKENKKVKSNESIEVKKQYTESIEDIQYEHTYQSQSQDGIENTYDSDIKNQINGKRLNYKKNVNIQSQSSMNSPRSQYATNTNYYIQPPSYYFGEKKKDLQSSNVQENSTKQQLISQQQTQSQSNQLIQVQIQKQPQQTQSDYVKHKFRITNTSERVNSQARERKQSQTDVSNITFQSQPDHNANVKYINRQNDTQQAEEQETEPQTDYSVIQAYINNNNSYLNGRENQNKLSNKETSISVNVAYTSKLAKQFDIKNNPYSAKTNSIDKSSSRRSKTNQNNSMNSKIGQIPVYLTENNHFLDKLKKNQEIQNPSVIIINQIQNTENNGQLKNSSQQPNQIYQHTINQLENIKSVTPQIQQVQSPVEKYISIIKQQVQNNNEQKNSCISSQNRSFQLNKSSVSSQQNTSFIGINETSQQFSIGAKKSVPDVLQSTHNSSKQGSLQMQRRISQPNQRSIDQDKIDSQSKNVQSNEKKNTQPKIPEFRTNAIAELRKQLNQANGELEFERNKNEELFAKFTAFRQKLFGKIEKKVSSKNEFEAEIINVEQKIKAMKKKLKAQEEELLELRDDADKGKILQPENEKLRFEVIELKSNIENINIKIDTKEKSISELHRALQNANSDIANLFSETTNFKQKTDDKQHLIESLEEQLRVSNNKNLEIMKLKQDLEYYKQSQQQNEQLKIDLERKKREYDQKLEEFNKLREENIRLKLETDNQYISLKEQNQKRELEYKQLQMNMLQQNKEKEQFVELLKDEKQKKEHLKSEVLKYQNDIATLIKRHQEEQTEYQNKILKAESIGLQNQEKNPQTKNQMLESENVNNKKIIQEYKQQIDDLNTKIKEYQQSTRRHSEIERLKNELIILQREKENQQIFYEQQIKDLKSQLNEEIRSTQIYSLKLENITKELQNFKDLTIPTQHNIKLQLTEKDINN